MLTNPSDGCCATRRPLRYWPSAAAPLNLPSINVSSWVATLERISEPSTGRAKDANSRHIAVDACARRGRKPANDHAAMTETSNDA